MEDLKEQYIKILRDYYEKTGKVPTRALKVKQLSVSGNTITKYFGKWSIALEVANLNNIPRRSSSKIIKNCANCNKELKLIPSNIKERNFCDQSCSASFNNHQRLEKKFAGLNEDEIRKLLAKHLNDYFIKHEKVPSKRSTTKELGIISGPTILKYFDSWKNALLSANIPEKFLNFQQEYCNICEKKLVGKQRKFCSDECVAKNNSRILWISSDIIKISSIEENNKSSKNSLKKYLINKNPQCAECFQGLIWNNKILTLEMDHIDGDGSNNVLSNVRLLCPNCHSQTPNFRARNTKNPLGKEHRRKRYKKDTKII